MSKNRVWNEALIQAGQFLLMSLLHSTENRLRADMEVSSPGRCADGGEMCEVTLSWVLPNVEVLEEWLRELDNLKKKHEEYRQKLWGE